MKPCHPPCPAGATFAEIAIDDAPEPRVVFCPMTGQEIDGNDEQAIIMFLSKMNREERRIERAKDAAFACLAAMSERRRKDLQRRLERE